ncbi:MATE family efflux transporter [Pullulanibacillus sp. KACC 23026]|uniref:MATE family efflux transporter n=1 Tax=Pullulanibacillus sp. KACC 23026 TaxID=3028315 RepID=UPI0023B20561|nr:MATE family efflux transporter [Pullulanibacillus sp. KACC 23026]WEG11071.1 MATE family efflux transporter [Pullulanibacillus sp. KACC 23026]
MERRQLTEGPIYRTVFFFSLPLLLGNILQSLNGTINSIWVGHYLGADAFAATANVNNINFLVFSLTFGIAMASSIVVGQHYGAKRYDEAKRVIGTGFTFFLLFSLVITVLSEVFATDLLGLLHTPKSVMPYAVPYLRTFMITVTFGNLYNFITMALRGAGDSKTPFYFLLVSVVIDTVMNPVLIFGLGPFPKMGIEGSATATLLAQFICLSCLISFLYYINHPLSLRVKELRYLLPIPNLVKLMTQRGMSMGLQMMVASTSSMALIDLVNTFGSTAVAAFSASMNITNYISMPAMAIGASVSNICSQNVGANQWDRVKRTFEAGLVYNLVMTGALAGLVYLFNKDILHLFVTEPAVVQLGIHVNDVTAWSFILFGVMNILVSTVRSTGAVLFPLLISFVTLWVIRIPFSYLFAYHLGINWVWWSFPISFIVSDILLFIYYFNGGWKRINLNKLYGTGEKMEESH